jgi:hypothetical protein
VVASDFFGAQLPEQPQVVSSAAVDDLISGAIDYSNMEIAFSRVAVNK